MKIKVAIGLSFLMISLNSIPVFAGEMEHDKSRNHKAHTAMTKDTGEDPHLNIDVQLHDLELLTQDRQRSPTGWWP
jgi:hypothetical protein